MQTGKYLFLLGLAILILGPLLWQPGYVFTLDMVVVPHMPFPEQVTSSFLYSAGVSLLSTVVPMVIIQKIILLLIIVIAGSGAQSLVQYITKNSSLLTYIASILFVVNPFTYSRFMTGQLLILLGYALLPFIVLSTLRFLARPSKQTAWQPLLYFTLTAMFSLHALGIALLLVGPLVGLSAYRHCKDRQYIRAMSIYTGAGFAAFFIINSYWILPIQSGASKTVKTVAHFNNADYTAFMTNDATLGVIANALSLRGFWGDVTGMYRMPEDYFAWWTLPLLLVLALVATGVVYGIQRCRGLTIALSMSAAAAVLLAISTAIPGLATLSSWAFEHLPFFAGYREPQKFLMVLAVYYAIFGTLGSLFLYKKLQSFELARLWHGAAIAIPLGFALVLTAPFMIGGFSGQLKTNDYPQDWYSLREELAKDSQASILFLPWHQYMDFDFAKRIIANPAAAFFKNPTIISANPEIKGAHAQENTPLQTRIETVILPAARHNDLGNRWSELGITYIVVAKEFDYKKYDFIAKQSTVMFLKETEHLKLYKIQRTQE